MRRRDPDLALPSLFDVPPPQPIGGIVRATTLDAGAHVPERLRATQRQKIEDELWRAGALTYHEIAARTEIDLQTVCWRMKELREAGRVEFRRTADGALDKAGRRRLVQLTSQPILQRAG